MQDCLYLKVLFWFIPISSCLSLSNHLDRRLIWTLFAVFTCLHLFANYKAVSAVTMETLNQQRLHIVLNDFFSTGSISSPASVNAREPILGGGEAYTISLLDVLSPFPCY